MLEAAQFKDNTFVTLTFRHEDMPVNGDVSPRDLQLFMKRLRFNTRLKLRYFGVGEYGDETWRPHYHVALFGFPNCLHGITRERAAATERGCCTSCNTIRKAWGLGNVDLRPLEQGSAQYVAGYTVKKMTKVDDWRLDGRHPEFARMSLRPGIGLGMMHELASTLMEHRLDERMIDVPLTLQHGQKQLPLGRYLRRKLRAMLGREENAPPEVLQEKEQEMSTLRKVAWDSQTPLSQVVAEKMKGRLQQIEAREKIRRKRGAI